jgi:hypothetical protein
MPAYFESRISSTILASLVTGVVWLLVRAADPAQKRRLQTDKTDRRSFFMHNIIRLTLPP